MGHGLLRRLPAGVDARRPDRLVDAAHLVVGPVNPRSDGTLGTSFDIDETHGPAMARDLATRAKAHHVVPMLMIGGAGEQQQWRSAATHHLTRLVNNLVATLRNYGYAGLDLDWEPIAAVDRSHVTALVNALRSRLPHAVLTMPVLPTSKTFPHVPSFYGSIAHKLDRIDVMTYGMAFKAQGWRTWHSSALTGAGAHTPTAVDVSVASYRAAGVPAAKLGGPQNCTFVSYEDNRSIEAKARWAKSHGLGSLIVWTVNQGRLRNAPAGHRDPLLATARHAFGA